MDTPRCKCPMDAEGKRIACHTDCAIHGWNSPVPLKPYILSDSDKAILRSMRIAISDSAAIQDVRKSDEDRWKERR